MLHVLSYPQTTRYLQRWTAPDGQRRERHVDALRELGRPTMGEIMDRISRSERLNAVDPGDLSGGYAILDTPAGMLAPQHYRQHQVLMINNNGSLPRCQLEEYVYRAGTCFLWHNRSDLRLFRRFFAQPFHQRSLYQSWFIDPPERGPSTLELPRGPTLAYCGRMAPEKRIDLLIHLLSLVRQHHDATLVLAGGFATTAEGTAYRAQIDALLDAFDLAPHVRWLGHVHGADLAAVFDDADLVVNLTVNRDETFGLAQAEALSFGTPVVVAGWGGLKEVVQGKCGFVADTLVTDHGCHVDLHSAARFVVEFLGDQPLQEKMAAAAKERATLFSWRTFLAGLKEHLAHLPSDPVPTLDPSSSVGDLLDDVLSTALRERVDGYLNPITLEQKVSEIHALRNAEVLGADEWMRLSLIDPTRHREFVRNNFLFLYEHYGTLIPEVAAARLADRSQLHPLRPAIAWIDGTTVVVDDEPTFGPQEFSLSVGAAQLLKICMAAPTLSVAEIASRAGLATSQIFAGAKELLAFGLLLPV